MPELIWTHHMLEQMELRCVSKDEVEDLLEDPLATPEPDEVNDSVVISGTVGGRHLEVAVTADSYPLDRWVLKTVMV